jgi:hypothetical protein
VVGSGSGLNSSGGNAEDNEKSQCPHSNRVPRDINPIFKKDLLIVYDAYYTVSRMSVTLDGVCIGNRI